MSLKTTFVTIRDNYVKNQVKNAKIPVFSHDEIKRMDIVFKGRVQHIGFRLEVCELAKRLGLTGYCENLENGDVHAKIQGPENKIQYLITFMESLKRIKITDKKIKNLSVIKHEKEFLKK